MSNKKRKKPSKKNLLAQYQKKDELTELHDEIKHSIEQGDFSYSVFADAVMSHFVKTHVEKSEKNLQRFLDLFTFDPDFMIAALKSEYMMAQYEDFMMNLLYYYLFNEPAGKREFAKIVAWLPTMNEKEILLSWPETYRMSIFKPIYENDVLHFRDMRDNKAYPIMVHTPEMAQELLKVDFLIVGMLLPTDNQYLSVTIGVLDPSATTNHLLTAEEMSQEEWEKSLLQLWYRDLIGMAHEFDDEANDEDMDVSLPYIPMKRKKGESNLQYAQRLNKQYSEAVHMQAVKEAESLLVKVIEIFPNLFIPRGNALPLLEAIYDILTEIAPIQEEDDLFFDDSLSHFWYLLMVAHLPEEVERLKAIMPKLEFDDGLPF